ncbi:LuxR C-terminal-related transcriptional regulator [Lentzea sp. NPDC051213]|uniref:helix-turn-helix transcriptional regulator n=1 Tax=Lentzea sp. NPDC051213 TaxID=3364126 RepID=UPI00379ACBC0
MQTTRVSVHAPDPITHAGLTAFLGSRPEFTTGEPAGGCDVAVLAADRVTAEVLTVLRQWYDDIRVPVVLIIDDLSDSDLLTLVECKVVGLLHRRAMTGDRLVSALLTAARGGGIMPPDLLGELLRHVERLHREVLAPRGLKAAGLSTREIELLRLIADGWDTNDIAVKLRYSERTVKKMIYTMTSRLNLRNRAHAVAYALRSGSI